MMERVLDMSFEEYLDTIRRFVDDEMIPAEAELVETRAVPERIVERMAELGLFGITIPRRYGGLEWSVEQQVRLTLEFTRASAVYRSRISTTIGLSAQLLLHHGRPEQREELLPQMAAGELVTAFALTEPEAGSDASNVQTVYRPTGGGFVLDGQKRYITNAAWADVLIVFAKSAEGAISAFLVPRRHPGVSTSLPTVMNGHEAGPVAEVQLDGVEVDAAALVGSDEGMGMRQALSGINMARTHVAATAVGQTTRMLAEAAAHVTARRQFGAPLSDLGVVQATLGDCYSKIAAGRALTLDCARAFDDAGAPPRHQISAAKLFCTEMASQVADELLQLLGGAGIVGDNPIPRMWRDVRALRIYEGASAIHRRNLGRAVLDPSTSGGVGSA